jgi:hypothetical protein
MTTSVTEEQVKPPLLAPLLAASETEVVPSVETTLLNWSSAETTTLNEVPLPAVVVAGGAVE